jgi:hypothetical protein
MEQEKTLVFLEGCVVYLVDEWSRDGEISFGHVEFELPVSYPGGESSWIWRSGVPRGVGWINKCGIYGI